MASRKVGKALHIFETDLWVNTDIYLEVMESTVLPWIKTGQEIVLGCGRKTWSPAMSPTGPSSGSRTTATTWS